VEDEIITNADKDNEETIEIEEAAEFEENPEYVEKVYRKIMYVDDINYALITIKERLKDQYEIYPTQSVEKMFEVLERVKIDLILLDINMPEVDGFEAIGKIKADKRYADIPVIFLTAQKDRKSIVKGMSLGAADFITKPISNENLIEHIEYLFDPEKRAAIKPAILAIDDNPSILQAINALLGDQYTVYTLPEVRVEQVLTELLKKITPDLFLLDYRMPVLTGFDLIPIIRKFPGHEETPIVFLTSEKTIDHVTAAAHLGVCDYIIKPIDEMILRRKMATHLADFVMRRRIRALADDRRK
jgi:response regulator RpfG family c-di-GMP phosphodiesterase